MPTTIQLPSERVEQLRAISEVRKITIADLIGELVAEHIAKGVIPAGVPGAEVARSGSDVTVQIAGLTPWKLAPDAALAFADMLRAAAAPASAFREALAARAEADRQRFAALREGMAADAAAKLAGLSIARRGTSVKVQDDAGGERTLAPSIARELADQLANAAK